MIAGCSHFVPFTREGNQYSLDVSDSSYFFAKCSSLLIDGPKVDPKEFTFRFIYEINGREVEEQCSSPNISFKETHWSDHHEYSCDIKRPTILKISSRDPKKSARKIKLLFDSNIHFEEVQLYVEASYWETHLKPNALVRMAHYLHN